MEKIRAILIDDEASNIETLEHLLKKHCPEVEICGSFTNPQLALREIPALKSDLLFLDIEMPGLSGFDLLENLKNYAGSVIFVTAYSTYAIRAIKLSALDYLLKPVVISELKEAVKKLQNPGKSKMEAEKLQQLSKNLEFLSSPSTKKIAVATSEGVEIMLLDEIDYVQADRSYVLFKRTGKRDIIVSKPLKDFEEALPGNLFMRIHKSYLVNLQKVVRYKRADGGYAVMEDGTEIAISRSYKDQFLEFLKV